MLELILAVAIAYPAGPHSAGPVETMTVPPASARLTLADAVARTLVHNPAIAVVAAAEQASEAERARARGSFLPRVDLGWTASRSDDPVYAFGTKLRQGRFSDQDFALDALNHPDAVSDYRTDLQLEQVLYDGGRRWLARDAAELGIEQTREVRRQTEMNLIYRAIATYFGVAVSTAQAAVLEHAITAADLDLERAGVRRDAGQATEAEALSILVHRAALQERRIRARSSAELGRAELNRLMGEPLDRGFDLVTAVAESSGQAIALDIAELERRALDMRSQLRAARLSVDGARNQRAHARSAYLPVVAAHAARSWHHERLFDDGQSNWLVALSVKLNLFNRLADRADVDRANAELRRREAELRAAEDEARIEVRRAVTELEAARQRVAVLAATILAARESHRITTDRHGAGLTTVTDLLRSHNALLGAESQHLQALFDRRLAAAHLELVVGQLGALPSTSTEKHTGEPKP